MKRTWEDELNAALVEEERNGVFGSNIEWDVKDVRRYIKKLEALGATDIHIPDYTTIDFELPADVNCTDLLLCVLTYDRMPLNAKYNKKKHRLTLEWDY